MSIPPLNHSSLLTDPFSQNSEDACLSLVSVSEVAQMTLSADRMTPFDDDDFGFPPIEPPSLSDMSDVDDENSPSFSSLLTDPFSQNSEDANLRSASVNEVAQMIFSADRMTSFGDDDLGFPPIEPPSLSDMSDVDDENSPSFSPKRRKIDSSFEGGFLKSAKELNFFVWEILKSFNLQKAGGVLVLSFPGFSKCFHSDPNLLRFLKKDLSDKLNIVNESMKKMSPQERNKISKHLDHEIQALIDFRNSFDLERQESSSSSLEDNYLTSAENLNCFVLETVTILERIKIANKNLKIIHESSIQSFKSLISKEISFIVLSIENMPKEEFNKIPKSLFDNISTIIRLDRPDAENSQSEL